MRTKTNPVLGLLVGVVLAWGGVTAVNYASIKLNTERTVRFESSLSHSLPWLLLILAVSAVIGLVLSARAIAAGALVGAGLLMTVVGVGVFVLQPRQAFDLSKLFTVPDTSPAGYIVWDGSVLFIGVILLVLGIRRWATDARSTPQPAQNAQGYFPYGGPQAQQFPSTQGQQLPGPQDQRPGQQTYPGQQGQQTYPGQQGQWPPQGQQSPGPQGYPPQDGPQQR